MACSCLPENTGKGTDRHPCFSKEAHYKFARMHLPVAPQCNIQCNYCNRQYDCVNESRPGVTSEILTPKGALDKYLLVKEKIPNVSVVGIAGPGDALANWDKTKKSIELIQKADSEIIFCLSTNGLMLPTYAAEIVALGIKHVTITMNTILPEIAAQIYHHVYYQGKEYRGTEGAEILLNNQLAGLEYLAQQGVVVKINTVMIPGINDQHIPSLVKKVKTLGATISNIMPLIPVQGTAFAHLPQTNALELNQMRDTCQVDLLQMRHCKQCRADAIGLLENDRSAEFRHQVIKEVI